MTDKPIIAVLCGDHRPPGMSAVETATHVRYASAANLPQALLGADVLFVWDFLSTALAQAWSHADRLRWVHAASAGVDPLMFPELIDSTVVLTNSRGIFDRPIAEYVLGLILLFAKDAPRTREIAISATSRRPVICCRSCPTPTMSLSRRRLPRSPEQCSTQQRLAG